MTLIVALKAPNGIILAGDARVHYPKTGFYLDAMKKIFTYNDLLAIGCLGNERFISTLDAHLARRISSKERHIQTLEEALDEFHTSFS
jgi:hypothetical protein